MSYDNRGRGGRSGGGRSYGGQRRSYGGGGGYQRRPREMHDTECSACGAKCQVPFKPSGDRPVYCRECYNRKRDENLTDEQMMASKPAATEVSEEAPAEEAQEEADVPEEEEEPEETVD